MTGILYALGGFCARRPYPVAVTWLVIVVGFVAVVNSVGKQTRRTRLARIISDSSNPIYASVTDSVALRLCHGTRAHCNPNPTPSAWKPIAKFSRTNLQSCRGLSAFSATGLT